MRSLSAWVQFILNLLVLTIIRKKVLSGLIMHEYEILSTAVSLSFCLCSKQDRYASEQTDQRRRNVKVDNFSIN